METLYAKTKEIKEDVLGLGKNHDAGIERI